MTKFSEYINHEDLNNDKINNATNQSKEKMEDLIDKYSKYSENDLMNEFLKLTYEKKKKGELNETEINSLKQTIMPFLNDEQKNNLDRLMNMVGNVK